MWLPLVVLAALSVVGGQEAVPYIKELFNAFHHSLHDLHHAQGHDDAHQLLLILGSAAWIIGLGGSFTIYKAGSAEDNLEKNQPLVFKALKKALFFDPLYNFYVTKVQDRIALVIDVLDKLIVQALLVRGSAGLVYIGGLCTRMLHNGNLQLYSFWIALGILVFGAVALGWIGS
jgi:NADH-quinone oxidoreductase subunit L